MTQMTEGRALISIVIGFAAIVLSLFTKQFYEGRVLGGATSAKSRPIPTWLGRLVFIIVGILFILVGLRFFLLDQ